MCINKIRGDSFLFVKKNFILLIFAFISAKCFSFPFSFGNFQNVSLKSLEKLYFLKESELSDYEKYKVNDAYVFCIADSDSELSTEDKKKDLVIGYFRIQVVSKNKFIDYKIIEAKIINDGEIKIEDILYLPYPAEKPVLTEFKKDLKFKNYYSSWFYVGFFKFPAKNKSHILIRIKIIVDSKEYELEYPYEVIKKHSFIKMND